MKTDTPENDAVDVETRGVNSSPKCVAVGGV
jgi:hypothetical protein